MIIIFRLCVFLLAISAPKSVKALELYTQRTQISRVVPELVSVFEREARKTAHSSDLFSSSVVAMTSRSYQDGLIGNYFGVYDNRIDSTLAFNVPSYDAFICVANPTDTASHISSRNIFQSATFFINPLDPDEGFVTPAEGRAKLNLNPEQRTQLVGLMIGYRFSSLFERFYCGVSLPFVRTGQGIFLFDRIDELRPGVYSSYSVDDLISVSVRDFFSGAYSNAGPDNAQQALTKAKLDGLIHYKTGFSDIKFKVGCFLMETEKTVVDVWTGVLVPAGNRQTMEFLLEPVTGNNGHVGLFAGGSFTSIVWDTDSAQRLEAYAQGEMNYLFSAHETRIVGFNSNGQRLWWDIYRLGAEQGGNVTFPMANVLARPVKVSPGFGSTGALGVKLHGGFFKSDISYSWYLRKSENVGRPAWQDNTYALVDIDYETTTAFDITAHAFTALTPGSSKTGAINTTDLLPEAATAPGVYIHGFNGSVGVSFEDYEWAPQVMVGVYCNFPSNNSAFKSYAAWIKGGVSF